MIKIQPIGRYFPIDDQGYVVNSASIDNVSDGFRPAIDGLCQMLVAEFGEQLTSIYLRGSVAMGYGVEPFSDLDLMVLTQLDDGSLAEGIVGSSEAWMAKHFPSQPLDVMVSCFASNTNPRLTMVLKTQACCIYGEDVTKSLAGYRPGPDMFLALPWLAQDLAEVAKLSFAPERIEAFRAFAKLLIRCSFELVMEQDKRYTKSLYYCIASFTHFYPEHHQRLTQFLWFYLNGESGLDLSLFEQMLDHGEWLLRQIKDL